MKLSQLFNRSLSCPLLDELWQDIKQVLNGRKWKKKSNVETSFGGEKYKTYSKIFKKMAGIVWNKNMKMMNLIEVRNLTPLIIPSDVYYYSWYYRNRNILFNWYKGEDYLTKRTKQELQGLENLAKLLHLQIIDIIDPPTLE